MNTTLSPVTVQRFSALQGELITLVEQDYTGLSPKLEQIIRAFEFTQIELAVYRDRGYARGRGVGQPEADRCALACAFLTKAVLPSSTLPPHFFNFRATAFIQINHLATFFLISV